MTRQAVDYHAIYEDDWRHSLAAGTEQRGNLQACLDFIETVDLISRGNHVLEIGCGIGTVTNHLTQKGFSVIGTDISEAAIEYGRGKYPNARLEAHPAENLPWPSESFDVVLSFDLFEHIPDTDRHLGEVRRLLRPGGLYLFQTPNKFANVIFETIAHKGLGWRIAHPSLHGPGQLRRRLIRNGFAVRFVKIDPVNEFMLNKLRKLGPCGKLARYIPWRRLPLCMQTNLFVVAQKTIETRLTTHDS